MSYPATVFRVMIASPGDVQAERRIARQLIFEWNSIHSEDKQMVLLPLGWEYDSYPQTGKSAQDVINEELLEKSDVLVGIFWTKIGTPTKEYPSGSIEELEKHIRTGKPTMLYFSKEKVDIEVANQEQYELLKKFKNDYSGRGLYWEYENSNRFKEIFKDQLVHLVNNNKYFKDSIKNNDIEEFPKPEYFGFNYKAELGMEARVLLKEAIAYGNGSFTKQDDLSGWRIQVSNKTILNSRDNREIAKWKNAIEQLELQNMVEDVNYKGYRYNLLQAGYDYFDK